jgi:antitoxin ParD1/3/4
MSIALTPIQEQLLAKLVSTGRYDNTAEALNAALQLLEEKERHYEQWLEETQQKIQVGVAQLERGESLDGEAVVERLREKLRKAREQAS